MANMTIDKAPKKLPLKGVRVVDFGQYVAGAQASAWLAVMGAEVIKIESTMFPDQMRRSFPLGKTADGLNRSIVFAQVNVAKKSITLNMKKPGAVELAKKLVGISDVVLENYSAGVLERWGMAYSDLKKIKPDIIMVSSSGWGRVGPYRDYPCYAPIVDAFTGLDSMNGYTGGKPEILGNSGWADVVASHHNTFAVLAALYHRRKTGEGQFIDYSMAEGNANFLGEAIMDYFMNGRIRGPAGNRDDIMAPHGCYPCKGNDKWVAIAVSSQDEWAAFCRAIGSPEWTKHEEFSDELSRWEHQAELDKLVAEWTRGHDQHDVMERLQKAGVMAGASIDLVQTMEDPHFKSRNRVVDVDHPEMGKLRLVAFPWRLSQSSLGDYSHPPLIGEHNDYVFGKLLGLSQDEILRLRNNEIIC